MPASIWRGAISFGLLNIPVTLRSAEEHKQLHFNLLDGKDLAPVKYKRVNSQTGKEVPYERIVKGYKYEPGQYVIVSDKDFEAANVKATQAIDIEDFVAIDEIDPLLFEKPYYLVPQKRAEKGYFLFRDALNKTNRVAIGRIVIRTKQHLVVVMAREDYLILEVLRFAHEVKQINEVNYLEEVSTDVNYTERELQMAQELIDSMTVTWDPDKYKDTYYDDLMARIERKIAAGESHTIEAPEKVEAVEPTRNVVDLLPLLQQSLKANKASKTKKKPRKSS